MGKRERKVKESWKCDDCNATNDFTKDYCDALEHHWAEQYTHTKHALQDAKDEIHQLKTENNRSFYMTKEEFTGMYTAALSDYLSATFAFGPGHDQRLHPEDIGAAIATFNDATFALLSNYSYNRLR
jgi:hypothetical protein